MLYNCTEFSVKNRILRLQNYIPIYITFTKNTIFKKINNTQCLKYQN